MQHDTIAVIDFGGQYVVGGVPGEHFGIVQRILKELTRLGEPA